MAGCQRRIVASSGLCYNITVDDTAWMREALAEAEQALTHGDVPVGAVAVCDGTIVGRGHNRREADADPTAHAEMIALREAARTLDAWRLVGVTLYCTLEPCPMCASAISHARVARLYYGASDLKSGGVEQGARVFSHSQCHHRPEVYAGVGEAEASVLLTTFFAGKRS